MLGPKEGVQCQCCAESESIVSSASTRKIPRAATIASAVDAGWNANYRLGPWAAATDRNGVGLVARRLCARAWVPVPSPPAGRLRQCSAIGADHSFDSHPLGCTAVPVRRYAAFVRTRLAVEDLDGLLDEPLLAVLATLRRDGSVLLSPVWFEWRDGGFNVWVEATNPKARHLRRDPRATIVVAESETPLRGVEVRGTAQFIDTDVTETAKRIAARYEDDDEAAADAEALRGRDVIVRLEPGELRAWDFADEVDAT
jgi:PPOX class probable F420-dependent enzyme